MISIIEYEYIYNLVSSKLTWKGEEIKMESNPNYTFQYIHKPTGMSPGDTFFKTFARSEFLSTSSSDDTILVSITCEIQEKC